MLCQAELDKLTGLRRVRPGQKNYALAQALSRASIRRALTHAEWQKVYAVNAIWERDHGAGEARRHA